MYSEDEFLPLSGLAHMAFCERRWALVHIENVWEDNVFTAEGNVLHGKAHSEEIESRPGVLIRRTMPVHSFSLGVSGQTDIIEFQPVRSGEDGIRLADRSGIWRAYPIEYKRSRDKASSHAYRIQLCAQALCLEEMLCTRVMEGAVYDATAKRRQLVIFDAPLRESIERLARRMHELFDEGLTPAPVLKNACKNCSLNERCFPEALASRRAVNVYYQRFLAE